MTDKPTLRREMRERRKAFVAALSPDARTGLCLELRDRILPRLPAEGIVAAYSAYGDEIDPRPILDALPGRAALPWFADRETPMSFRLWSGEPLDGGPFGIPQPRAGALAVVPDVLLVPFIAVDPRCHRLGQGKGHYDRALAAMATAKAVSTIGIGWEVQIVAEVPCDIWDMPLDAVATERRWLTPAS